MERLREWAEMVQSCKSSGKTVATWCGENGINPKTYYLRQRQVFTALPELRNEGIALRKNTSAASFVEVLPPAEQERACAITIQLHGAHIVVENGVSADILEKVLAAVSRIC